MLRRRAAQPLRPGRRRAAHPLLQVDDAPLSRCGLAGVATLIRSRFRDRCAWSRFPLDCNLYRLIVRLQQTKGTQMLKIGDKVKIRIAGDVFSVEHYKVTSLRRGIVETDVGTFNRSDVRKV